VANTTRVGMIVRMGDSAVRARRGSPKDREARLGAFAKAYDGCDAEP
jgi:hypothetical protein